MAGRVYLKGHSEKIKDIDDELEKLYKKVHQLEETAAGKDQQISFLMSRMREYEMGEYGLAEAVGELKECHRIIRAREWEIEKLTEEINEMKLKMSNFAEKSNKTDSNYVCAQVLGEEVNIFKADPVASTDSVEDIYCSKSIQCCLPMQPSMYEEEICSTQVQNEMLRIQLRQVCEEALETSLYLQKMYKQRNLKYDGLYKYSKENISKTKNNSSKSESCVSEGYDKCSENIYKTLEKHVSSDSAENEEAFHELMNEMKLLKSRHMTLIRRYIILADKEEIAHKENLKLRKALNFYWRKNNFTNQSGSALEFTREPSKHRNCDETVILKELHGISQNACFDSQCQESINKLLESVLKLQRETSVLKQLLEIAHHQTQATEAMCFTQEVEMKALRSQFSLLQAQSDEKMLLGKLAMKVLQLQFSQAASIYELKKCKSDKLALQDWYALLKKEYEENGKKFAGMYLDAQDKVKHLREVLKDLCQRCNAALSSYLPQN